jgi:hypothetical protein
MQNISQHFGWTNISIIPAWMAGTLAMMQGTDVQSWFYSGVFSAIVVTLIVTLGRVFDKIFDGRKANQERADRQNREKQDRADELHAREKDFLQTQNIAKTVECYGERKAKHRAVNEIGRLHVHFYETNALLADKGIKPPDFKLIFGDELMEGIEDEVEMFRQSLIGGIDEVIHRTAEAVHKTTEKQ